MEIINKLIKELSKLPGIGTRTATRLAYHIARDTKENASALATAILTVKSGARNCPRCLNLIDQNSCPICDNPDRNKGFICVVEDPQDVEAIEKTGVFKGVYHILHGALSPLDGTGPDDIRVQELINRLKGNDIRELIIATNPTTSGEATALYIAGLAKPFNIKLTRLALGIPFGGDIEYVDKSTLARSIEARSNLT